jgi:hypothetical protein
MVVAFRPLGFRVTEQLTAIVESEGRGGIQRTGRIDPIRRDFSNGYLITVSARDIPANSNLILKWGI